MPRIDKQTILEGLPKPVTRALVRIRNSERLEQTLRTRQRRRVRGMFRSGAPIAVDITRAGGLGGIMQNGALALANGCAHNVDVALSFRCSTYVPSWGAEDWLDCYFVRRGSAPNGRRRCDARDLPSPRYPPVSEVGHLLLDF